MFPAAVQPEILPGIESHEPLERRRHPLRDGRDSIGFANKVLRVDQIDGLDRVAQQAARIAHSTDIHERAVRSASTAMALCVEAGRPK